MPYLGRPVTNTGFFEVIDDISSGFDGSDVSFTLQVGGTDVLPDASNLTVVLDGVVQIPSSAYSVTGSTINFSEAPESGVQFHGVLAGSSQFVESSIIVDSMVKSTANISGSKINTDFSAQTVKAAIFDGMISGSAQLADDISGSFSKEHLGAKVANVVTSSAQLSADISGSFSKEHLGAKVANVVTSSAQLAADISGSLSNTAIADLEAGIVSGSSQLATDISGSFGNQRVGTSDSPTFAGGTITGDFAVGGTLTAQEVHTEFESASILFTSGSTQFGNSSDDVHDFKGNTISGSITSTGSFGSIVTKGTGVTTFIGGNVGVGTDAPADELEVHGATAAIKIRSTGTDAGNNPSINFQSTEATGLAARAEISADDDGATTKGALIFKTRISDSVTEAMRIDGTGKVGIGTNDPQTGRLHIHNGDSGATSYAQFTQDGTGAGSGDGLLVGVNAAEASIIYNAENTPLIFYTNTSERVRIDNAGLVGIGTATSLAKLHVEHTTDDTDENGNIAMTVGGGASGDVRHYWGVNNSSNYAYYGAVEHATQYVPLVLQPNGSLVSIGSPTHNTRVGQQLALTAGGGSNRGGIAINTYLADTQSPLIDFNRSRSNTVGSHTSVNSGDGIGALIWRGSDGDEFVDTAAISVEVDGSPGNNDMPGRIMFFTTPDGTNSLVERMRITNAGNIGINTNSPNSFLHIKADDGDADGVDDDGAVEIKNLKRGEACTYTVESVCGAPAFKV